MIRSIKPYVDFFMNDAERSPVFYIWICILVTLCALAAFALLMSLIHSLEIFEFSINIPWGTMVSNYVFLVGSSVGLCLVASLGSVFGLRRYRLIAKRGVFLALITIVFGLSSIGLHLGHPERGAVYNLLTPNFRSAMWWMAVIYPLFIAFLAVWFWLLAREDLVITAVEAEGLKAKIYRLLALEGLRPYLYRILPLHRWEAEIYRRLPLEQMGLSLDADGADVRWAQIVGALALILGLAGYTVEGSLFAHTEARPLWYGALTPVDFFLGAGLCGLAWMMSAGIITYKAKGQKIPAKLKDLYGEMAQILVLFLIMELLFMAYKMGHGLFEPAKAKTIMLFVSGSFSTAFWMFEIAVGLVLPIPILLYSARQAKTTGMFIAALMVLVGYFVKRYDFVVAAQVYPVIKGGLSSYLPTVMEALLIAGIIAGVLLAYTLAEKFLPLQEEGYGLRP